MNSLSVAVGLAGLTLSVAANASTFEKCDREADQPDVFQQELREDSLARTPVAYFDLGKSIELLTRSPDATQLIPFATEQNGKHVIVFPATFAVVVCRLVFSQVYAHQSEREDLFDHAAGVASKCFADANAESECLILYANLLDGDFRSVVANARAKAGQSLDNLANVLYHAAVRQILMHEYAHQYLQHARKMKSGQLTRIDAEFEADVFSVLNGAEEGEITTAMAYFFGPLSKLEEQTNVVTSQNYETNSCRYSNVENITGAIGLVPTVIIAAANTASHHEVKDPIKYFNDVGKMTYSSGSPTTSKYQCGRIAKVPLDKIYAEFHQLYQRIELDLSMLYNDSKDTDTVRMRKLVSDLVEYSSSMTYANSVAAKCASLIVTEWEIGLGSVSQLTTIPDESNRFISKDFGRLLQADALSILYDETERPLESRMGAGRSLLLRAVYYNPNLMQSWANLSLISMKSNDCLAAANFADKAVATANPEHKDDLDLLKQGAEKMRQVSKDEKQCSASMAGFDPFPTK